MTGNGFMRRGTLKTLLAGVLAPFLPHPVRSQEAKKPANDDGFRLSSSNLDLASLSDEELGARSIRPLDIGEVVIETGRVRACDPLSYPDFSPLARTIPPGRYPVRLYFAFDRVAAAVMRIAPGVPASWEPATNDPAGKYGSMLNVGGYPVDAGMGSYMDEGVLAQMDRRIGLEQAKKPGESINYYDDVTAEAIQANNHDWAMHKPMDDSDLNVAMFASGWGDGFYTVMWGLSADGKPLVLLTDFNVIANSDGRKEPEE